MSNNQVAVQNTELSMSQRFSNAMIQEFQSGVGEVNFTEFQQNLVQNYFISIDIALKNAEVNRLRKSEKYREPLSCSWDKLDLQELARDIKSYAKMGLDPIQKNHINPIPIKDTKRNGYQIMFIEGYRGLEIKAYKYGLDVPDAVIIEVVYSTDTFKPIKKSRTNKVEDYEFEIVNPFDRGEIIGGFYYHQYNDNPSKNKLVIMTLKDIEKRKPRHGNIDFWGGEKDVWENGRKTGKKEKVEGWYEEMVYKTIHRAAYNDIAIDSQKIDADYLRVKQLESLATENLVQAEIEENSNQQLLDFDTGEILDGEVVEEESEVIDDGEQLTMEGPGY